MYEKRERIFCEMFLYFLIFEEDVLILSKLRLYVLNLPIYLFYVFLTLYTKIKV